MPLSLESLAARLPAGRVETRPAILAAHESDAQTSYRRRACALVSPESTAEVATTVRWCHEQRVPFVARGSGTGLCGGAMPVADGILIGLHRMNRILQLDPRTRTAVVQAGVINLDVSAAAAAHGLFYAPDPSSQPVCTIGGNVGFNAGGAHCLKHGMTSNHVLGLTAVLPDGEIATWGSAARETIGPDWTGLFVGNEGLFGIATEITLNLKPQPEDCHTVLAGFADDSAAADAVAAIIAAGLIPVAMELMDEMTLEAVRPVVPIDYPPAARALLIIELDGPADALASERTALHDLLKSQGATGLVIARDAAERARIWKVRKSAYGAYGRYAPNVFVQDCVVPRRQLAEALRRINAIAADHGLRCANVCHAGDGNIHPNLFYNDTEPGALARVEAAAAEMLAACVELGGSITGEHGVGVEKRPQLRHMFGPAELDLLRRLQAAYDPTGLANPGKMLEPAEART